MCQANRSRHQTFLAHLENETMSTNITSNPRPLLRALSAFFIATAAVLAMPRNAHAQIYVTSDPILGEEGMVSEYDATTGALINANFVTGFLQPGLLALKGNILFVPDQDTGVLGTYNARTGAAINSSFITGLSPFGIALWPNIPLSRNTLFVANIGSNTVGAYDAATGATINASFITGLSNPTAIVVQGNNLFVANSQSFTGNTVGKYNAHTGAVINASFITGLDGPFGIAIQGDTLFVANETGAIGTYNARTGAVINANFITGVIYPTGIAVKIAK
jgi:hypothetical protein